METNNFSILGRWNPWDVCCKFWLRILMVIYVKSVWFLITLRDRHEFSLHYCCYYTIWKRGAFLSMDFAYKWLIAFPVTLLSPRRHDTGDWQACRHTTSGSTKETHFYKTAPDGPEHLKNHQRHVKLSVLLGIGAAVIGATAYTVSVHHYFL